jgi:Tfp pilus assembly protein FimT
MNPADAERNLSEKEDEMVLAIQLARAQANNPQPVGAAQNGGGQQGGTQAGTQQPAIAATGATGGA